MEDKRDPGAPAYCMKTVPSFDVKQHGRGIRRERGVQGGALKAGGEGYAQLTALDRAIWPCPMCWGV